MKKYLIIFFILISIKLIKSEEIYYDNQTTFNLNNSNITKDQLYKEYLKMIENIKLTDEERDKLIFCGTLSHMKVNQDEKIIDDILKKIKGISKEEVNDKYGTVLIKKCIDNVNIETVRKNLGNDYFFEDININKEGYTYFGDFDYYTYKTKKDLIKTEEELQLTYKFHKAIGLINKKNEEFNKKREKNYFRTNDRKRGKRKLEAFGLELKSIPTYIKAIVFIVVFVIIFGGILYYINKIINKPKKEKKDKKKKKKTQ